MANGVGGDAVPLSRDDSLLWLSSNGSNVAQVVVVWRPVLVLSTKLSEIDSKFGETLVNGVNTVSPAMVRLFSSMATLWLANGVLSDEDNSAEDNEQLEELLLFWLLWGTVEDCEQLFTTVSTKIGPKS